MSAKKDKKNMTFKEKVIENINVFLSAYAIAFVIRLFIIEAYQIPSQSMVPSLLVRDILMVEKVTMGTRIPIINFKIPGLLKLDRDDIMVFVSPAWKSPGIGKEIISLLTLSLINLDNTFDTPKNLVKRVVGLPGDTISMSNQVLSINHEVVKTEYVITSREAVFDRFKKVGYTDFDMFNENYKEKNRIVQHLFNLDKNNNVDYSEAMVKTEDDKMVNNFDLLRYILVYDFPEITVPKKGDVIILKEANGYYKYLLKMLIERESGKTIAFMNGTFYLEGKELTDWKVQNNYYFGMGDNRDYSEDCRYFGFVPEKNVFGRPLFRYYPFDRLGFDANENENSIKKRSFN